MSTTSINTGALRPSAKVTTTGALALFLGGQSPEFTGLLLRLIALADSLNLAGLRENFPDEVFAWEVWQRIGPDPTAGQLRSAIDDYRGNQL